MNVVQLWLSCLTGQVPRRVAIELLLAVRAAEVHRLALIVALGGGVFVVDLHSTYRVGVHSKASWVDDLDLFRCRWRAFPLFAG